MRVGVVTKWFNRGQPVVARQLRSAVDELGHETFVLARPKKERGPRPGALDRDDVWDQPGITEGSEYDIPREEYVRWAEKNRIEAILCDQNYQFAGLAELRSRGVRTIGRTSPPRTWRGRAMPSMSFTRSPAPSRSATGRWGSRLRTCPGGVIRS